MKAAKVIRDPARLNLLITCPSLRPWRHTSIAKTTVQQGVDPVRFFLLPIRTAQARNPPPSRMHTDCQLAADHRDFINPLFSMTLAAPESRIGKSLHCSIGRIPPRVVVFGQRALGESFPFLACCICQATFVRSQGFNIGDSNCGPEESLKTSEFFNGRQRSIQAVCLFRSCRTGSGGYCLGQRAERRLQSLSGRK